MTNALEDAKFAAWAALKEQWDEFGHSTMTVAGIASEAVFEFIDEQGYEIVKRGNVPSWMETCSNTYCDGEDAMGGPCGELNCNCDDGDVEHYRLVRND
jgi:hypothetical protein